MEVSIIKTVYSKFNYINSELIQNIMNHLNFNNYAGKGILTRKTYPINLLQQVGGVKKEIKLKDGYNYEYHIDEIIPIDDESNRICFFNIEESHDNCACLLYNTKKSGKTILKIEGIFNGEDCIKCVDKKHKYKVGNILMQIIIELVKSSKEFYHITEIELSDTSIKKYNGLGLGLGLKYLRTITNGEPYYAKYGFRPNTEYDIDIFRFNRSNYRLNKKILNKELFEIITDAKLDKQTNEVYKKYLYNYIKSNNEIDPKIYLTELINLINYKNITENEKKYIWNFVYSIYQNLYNKLGYKNYRDKIWILQFKK
jgi:hypothetical protein